MRIAWFEPFSGASGDMTLGALVDAGAPVEAIIEQLGGLRLEGWTIEANHASQNGIAGTRVIVHAKDDEHSRTWRVIREMIERSSLSDRAKATSIDIFQHLAVAEAAIHDATIDDVHFHEVGGIDAIIDICGAAVALELLGIERVYSAPPRIGSGFAKSMHGVIPVPAPATARMLANARVPLPPPNPEFDAVPGELLTPTGAAILTALATFERPAFTPVAIGYGYGSKEFPWPNALRVWIGDLDRDGGSDDRELVIETNIDDMNPQHFGLLLDRLFEAGALDAWLSSTVMKKGRPGVTVSAIGTVATREALAAVMIEQSSTLGVRIHPIERVKAVRRFETVSTRWGDVRLKLRGWNGRVIDTMPEHDDCHRIAVQEEIPLRVVWNEAHRMGEAFVGLEINEAGELRRPTRQA